MAKHNDDLTAEPRAIRKIDDMAERLDDMALTVDEIKDEPEGIDEHKLDKVKKALDRATDLVDEIENEEGGN